MAKESSMKLLILGATGKVGSKLMTQGLERGFEVTVLVRSPEKVQIKDHRLKVVAGNPLDARFSWRKFSNETSSLHHPARFE
jgi:nucleoside-diphosphate-sugar epimerase